MKTLLPALALVAVALPASARGASAQVLRPHASAPHTVAQADVAQATVAQANDAIAVLVAADDAWALGDFAAVAALLEPLLLPVPPSAGERDVRRALERLGASALYIDDPELAGRAFLALLQLDPRHELDPFLYPDSVLGAFAGVRSEHAETLGLVEPPTGGAETVYLERVVRDQSLAVSMIPLGVGFFASERPIPGAVWLGTQAALGVSSLGLWLRNETQRIEGGTLVGPQGGLPRTDAVVARQRAHVALGGLFLGAVAANMLHGAITHARAERVELRILPGAPPELLGARPDRRWRVAFAPILPLDARARAPGESPWPR